MIDNEKKQSTIIKLEKNMIDNEKKQSTINELEKNIVSYEKDIEDRDQIHLDNVK